MFSNEGLATTVISSKERNRILKGTSSPGLIWSEDSIKQMPVTRILEPNGICLMGGISPGSGGWW